LADTSSSVGVVMTLSAHPRGRSTTQGFPVLFPLLSTSPKKGPSSVGTTNVCSFLLKLENLTLSGIAFPFISEPSLPSTAFLVIALIALPQALPSWLPPSLLGQLVFFPGCRSLPFSVLSRFPFFMRARFPRAMDLGSRNVVSRPSPLTRTEIVQPLRKPRRRTNRSLYLSSFTSPS